MTGFSYQTDLNGTAVNPKYVEYTNSSESATSQIHDLLTQFFTVWSEYKSNPFYITGESYGGLYTAFMGQTIVQKNNDKDTNVKINLKGVAVGDPILNAKYQFPTYANTLKGMGLVMDDEYENIKNIMDNAVKNLDNCPVAFKYWNSVWNDNGGGGAPGLFYQYTGSNATMNQALPDAGTTYDQGTKWMQNKDVMSALHYDGTPNHSTDEGGDVYISMVNSGDFCKDSSLVHS